MLSANRDRKARERRRRKAARLFVKGFSQAKVAEKLNVSREACRKWYDSWKSGGLKGLNSAGKPGPKSKLTPIKLKKIESALLKGPIAYGFGTQIWTLGRIAAVVKKVAKVKYGTTRVWQILGALNWTCQRPHAKPVERNEQAIRRWVKATWPYIKKKQAEWALN